MLYPVVSCIHPIGPRGGRQCFYSNKLRIFQSLIEKISLFKLDLHIFRKLVQATHTFSFW